MEHTPFRTAGAHEPMVDGGKPDPAVAIEESGTLLVTVTKSMGNAGEVVVRVSAPMHNGKVNVTKVIHSVSGPTPCTRDQAALHNVLVERGYAEFDRAAHAINERF